MIGWRSVCSVAGRHIAVFLPIGLWALLWFSIQAGHFRAILYSENPLVFLNRLRATLLIVAGVLAMAIMLAKLRNQQPRSFGFFDPLGFAVVYGLVGIAAAILSPSSSLALYWAAAYLSVPLVLWAVVWGPEALEHLRRVINFTWLLSIVAALGFFTFALLYLDLGTIILTPSSWLECPLNERFQGESYFSLSSGVLRPTGVGRFAAIAGVIALGGLWRRNWRLLWLAILFASLVLLVSSGARTAITGFVVAAVLTFFLYGGKKAIIVGVIAVPILISLLWIPGAHQTFLDKCIFKTGRLIRPAIASETISVSPAAAAQLPASQQGQPSTVGPEPSKPEAEPLVVPPIKTSDSSGSRYVGGLFTLTGRTNVWGEGWELFKESPLLGYGFQADRLKLNAHMHNSYMHALVQTGILGTLPFVAALIFTWILLIQALRKLNQLPIAHKHLVIQTGAILALLTVRTIPESTGAFFGIDWLFLAPILLYLHVINRQRALEPSPE